MRILLLPLLLCTMSVWAQDEDPPRGIHTPMPWEIDADSLSDQTSVSLLTMLPGEEIYSLFGHSSIRIHDPVSGLDWTYNYGTFNFDQSFFVIRFLRGTLDYVLDSAPFESELARYRELDRPIIEQRLDLSPEITRELFQFLEWNVRPENRAYRYDFFYDNCSTRILDAFDRSLAIVGSSTIALPEETPDETFRKLLQPYIEEYAWLQTGINIGLGSPADKRPTPRQQTFLPIELMEQIDHARIDGQPLAVSRDTLFWPSGYGEEPRPIPWPLIVSLLTLALAIGLTIQQGRKGESRWAFRFDVVLFCLAGLSGLILLFLWIASDHGAPNWNLNLLWAWPTHLLAAWALRKATLSPGWKRYALITSTITGVLAVVWLWLPQPLPPAAWPIAAALALRGGFRATQHVEALAPSP